MRPFQLPRAAASAPSLAAALALSSVVSVQAAPQYHMTTTGVGTAAFAINRAGVVLGSPAMFEYGIYKDGSWTVLAPPSDNFYYDTAVQAIDRFGNTVGRGALDENGYELVVPMYWNRKGQAMQIPMPQLPPYQTTGAAEAISSDGKVVAGALSIQPGNGGCFTWVVGTASPVLFSRDTTCEVQGINEQGTVVGSTQSGVNSYVGFVYAGGTVTAVGGLPAAGTSGSSQLVSVNDRNQAVGSASVVANDPTSQHAVLWNGTALVDLGTLPGDVNSSAWGIDDRGEVVGNSYDANFNGRPFLYANGQMQELVPLIDNLNGLTNLVVYGLNAEGAIVGYGEVDTGDGTAYEGFVLTPVKP